MQRYFTFCYLAALLFSTASFSYDRQTDSLLSGLKKAQHDTVRIAALIKLSGKKGIKPDSSLSFARQAVDLAGKIKDNTSITTSYVALAKWFMNHSQVDSAVALLHDLSAQMTMLHDTLGMAQASRYLGKAYLFNRVDSAIFYNQQSMSLFKSIGDSMLYNSVKTNLAVVYAQSDRLEEAIQLTKEALGYCERTAHLTDVCAATVNIAIFYRELGQFDSAVVYMKKNAYYHSLSGNEEESALAKNGLGEIFLMKKSYAEAADIYRQMVNSGHRLASSQLLNYGYKGLSLVSRARKEWEDEIRFLNKEFEYSAHSANDRSYLYENLYTAYANLKNFEKAYSCLLLFVAANDSFHSAERKQNMDQLEAKYQNKEKLGQIELLNKENLLKEAAVKRQALIRNGVIGACLLAFVVSLLLFSRFRLKKKIEKQQAVIDERKRISRELHDDLGAQLSTAKMFLHNIRNNAGGHNNTALETSLSLIESSIGDLRGIMDELQTSVLQDKGYLAATEELVYKINQLRQVRFSLTHFNSDQRMDSQTEHHLFRITQELINNSMKYAQAKNVSINLVWRKGKLVMMYEDDGSGFSLSEIKKGNGLLNIESRAQSLGGRVEFDTAPGNGFRCNVELAVA